MTTITAWITLAASGGVRNETIGNVLIAAGALLGVFAIGALMRTRPRGK